MINMAMGAYVPHNLQFRIMNEVGKSLSLERFGAGGVNNDRLFSVIVQHVGVDHECVECKSFYLYHIFQILCKDRKYKP